MRSLFPRRVSVKDIEREVTEQWETMVRSGKNPPPSSWTLLGGLHGQERPVDEPAPVTRSAVEVDEPVVEPVVEELDQDAPTAEAEAEPTVKPKRARSASSSRARSTGTRASSPRPKGTSTRRSSSGTRSRSS